MRGHCTTHLSAALTVGKGVRDAYHMPVSMATNLSVRKT